MTQLDLARLHPSHDPQFCRFPSRRSTVFSAKGAIATTQPLACQAGIEILQKGGNAADAAVATAAAMNVCEPCSTGIGGDIFCLFYDAKTRRVRGVNGSGRSPAALTLQYLRSRGIEGSSIPSSDLNSVTVPGAAAGWLRTIAEFGSGMSMKQILEPAIRMAREGVPEHELASREFRRSETFLKEASVGWPMMMMPDGAPPLESQIMSHPQLADTFEAVANHGHDGFYRGRIAQAIVDLVQSKGGLMTMNDLASCEADVIEPIKYDFRASKGGSDGISLWECPPNGQGLTALVAMGIIEAWEEQSGTDILTLDFNSAAYLHILIEALRLAFAAQYFIGDPSFSDIPRQQLLDKTYLHRRASVIRTDKAQLIDRGDPLHHTDTIYLATADRHGNSCSFIASNYGSTGFGSGAIPEACGFTLQNRGSAFTLEEGHPNNVQGGKRPYHTIIPGMVTCNGELLMSFGVMGAFMQPQGQVQVLLNKLRGFSCQAALDAPRFCISGGMPDTATSGAPTSVANSEIWFEDGIADEVLAQLRKLGHKCERSTGYHRALFGRGQLIQAVRDPSGRTVWACGSDPRGDGCAVPEI